MAALHTVEFQKRGLPHAHLIFWLVEDTSNPTPALVDRFISAEIPDPNEDPLGYALVAEHMIHGPCGSYNPNAPCMKNGKCSKGYPKNFQNETIIDPNGFATYKRPDNCRFVQKGPHKLSNQWVVPYNMYLLKKFQAHINVEWCNKGIFIKYLFKYVTKGPDCSKAYLQRLQNGEDVPEDEETQTRNEVKEYLDCRYICEQDACWRIFGFDIHRHYPAVERLPVHLPDENNILYHINTNMVEIISNDFLKKTMLTEWFTANRTYETARTLTYLEFPSKWRWVRKTKTWQPRQGSKGKIGRLYYVHPSVGERYYLRILLMNVKGARSYEDIRTYNGITYPTFKAACNARGLLGNDQEWYHAFDEAAAWATSAQLRQLFVTMLLYCEIADEYAFFEKVWRLMADDIQYQIRENIGNKLYTISEPILKDSLLDDLTTLFARNGGNIREHNIPSKTNLSSGPRGNRLIEEELNYDATELLLRSEEMIITLNDEQLHAFNTIIAAVNTGTPAFYFVSGYGGTGKTYLWNTIVTYLRGNEKIVLTVASSGVASLLLPGGRTAHSRFKIPCELDDDTVCDIKRGTMLADLIQQTSLIIWDEALMTHRRALETLDRTLRDLLSTNNPDLRSIPFGGKVVVLGGDPRQILPVIEGGTRNQIIDAAIINSPLWSAVTILTLHKNMRLQCPDLDIKSQKELLDFSNWVLSIGEGNLESQIPTDNSDEMLVKIPEDLLIKGHEEAIPAIVNAIYTDLINEYQNIDYLKSRAILCPTNDSVDEINNYIVSLLPGDGKQYLSCDKIVKAPDSHESYDILYPVELLNSLNGSNFPTHELTLKVGVPIMLLRNLNQSIGLCNGTRLIVTALGDMVIQATIISGTFAGRSVLIPRIQLTLKNQKLPFVLQRR